MQAKTLKIRFPDYVPDKYLSAYVRGVFDGDGCVSICYTTSKPKGSCNIAGTELFIKDLQKIFIEKLNVHATVDNQCGNSWAVDINRQEDMKIFLDCIYGDANIYLERKYQKYLEFLNSRDFSQESVRQRKRRIQANKNDIIQAYLGGQSISQISETFRCSSNAIFRLLKKENIQPNRENKKLEMGDK